MGREYSTQYMLILALDQIQNQSTEQRIFGSFSQYLNWLPHDWFNADLNSRGETDLNCFVVCLPDGEPILANFKFCSKLQHMSHLKRVCLSKYSFLVPFRRNLVFEFLKSRPKG